MKTANLVRSVLVTVLFGAASAGAAESADGHAQAAALLSRPATSGAVEVTARTQSRASRSEDGHAQAAALLSRPQTVSAGASEQPATYARARQSADGHAKAAALLSRPRTL